MLSPKAIQDFKMLYLREYGIKLSDDQAVNLGTHLIKFIKTVYGKAVPKKWVAKIDRSKDKS